jgi:hypothetical protein
MRYRPFASVVAERERTFCVKIRVTPFAGAEQLSPAWQTGVEGLRVTTPLNPVVDAVDEGMRQSTRMSELPNRVRLTYRA